MVSSHDRAFSIPAPTADVEVLFRILHTHLEDLKLPERPIGVRLSIQAVAPARDQLQLFESALRDPNRFGETLAKLKAFLGNEHVGVPARSNTHRPDSYVLADCFTRPKQKREDTRRRSRRSGDFLCADIVPPSRAGVCPRRPSDLIGILSGTGRDSRAMPGLIDFPGNWWDSESWQQEEWDVALAKGRPLPTLTPRDHLENRRLL